MNHWVVIAAAAPEMYLDLCLQSIFEKEIANKVRTVVVLDHPATVPKRERDWNYTDWIINFNGPEHNVSANWNIGINHAMRYSPDVITILNDDTVMWMPDGLNTMAELALKHNAIVGPVTNEPGGRLWQLAKTWGYGKQWESWPILNAAVPTLAPDGNPMPESVAPDHPGTVNGFCMTMDAWILRERHSPWFNETKCAVTGNEDDFQMWSYGRGIRSLICPRVFVWHFKGVSRDALSEYRKYSIAGKKVRL